MDSYDASTHHTVDRASNAIEFLKAWSPEGLWVLSAIDPLKTGVIETKTFDAAREQQAYTWVHLWNGRRNIYFSVNQPREASNNKTEKKDIGQLIAFHVDIDPVDPPKNSDAVGQAAHYEAQQATILAKLQAYTPAPSVIVYSGGGYQGFWLLREVVEVPEPTADVPEPWAALEAFNRQLEKELGGDHCFNIDRIMRLPFTLNLPNKKKQAKGRVAVLSGVVSADWDLLYGLTDFKPLVAEKSKYKPKTAKSGDGGLPRRDPPEWLARVMSQGPDPEGERAYGGDRSKAVWAVCCGLVRCGWDDAEIITAITDRAHGISKHVLEQPKPEVYAARQAARARDKVAASGDFNRSNQGKPIGNQANIRRALGLMGVRLTRNTFANEHMIEGPDGEPARLLDDDGVIALWSAMEARYELSVRYDYFHRMIVAAANNAPYHPVKDYLGSLHWDGTSRIDSWVIDYFGADDTPFVRAVGRLVLVAAVRRVQRPGVKFDEMLVMISPQGLDKSTGIATLAVRDEWFTDHLSMGADDRQVVETLAGKWIVEVAELKGMRNKDVEHVKALLSRQVDRARPAYGRLLRQFPRQCVFFGTTNSDSFLHDTTGNRRFWPVRTAQTDIAALRRDRDQLWAEAAHLEAAGESIRLDPSLYEAAATEQARRTIDDPWFGEIAQKLEDIECGKVRAHDLWALLEIPNGQRTQHHNARLGEAMRGLGWERTWLRSSGQKPSWHYAKGTDEERRRGLPRILIERDHETGKIFVTTIDGDTADKSTASNNIPF